MPRSLTLRGCVAALALGWSLGVLAQNAAPPSATEFLPGASELRADDLKARLAGKVFRVTRADGNHWRLQFQDNGYVFLNTHNGFADDGRWRVEGSKLCADMRRAASGCSDMRLVGDALYLKRAVNGEIVRYEVQ
jgi:hypothetical protein